MSLKRYRHVVGRRPARPARAATLGLESLESRVMFNGLTVILHGAQLFSGLGSNNRPGWVDQMGQQIAARYGGNTAVYLLRVEPNGDSTKVTSFTRVSGAVNSAASTSGETVLLVDWAKASNVDILGLTADYSGTKIANSIIPYITTAFPAAGITAPLGEGPIQLIGHSRGGSVISELAKGLGAVGMWVDQVTFLDPRPVPPDPLISLKSNVIFSDDYFQTSGDGLIVPNGIKVTGAHNVGPLNVEGAGLGSTHNNIVLFYQGTVDLADQSVPGSWYSGNALNRGSIGFYFSHGGGGAWARPAMAWPRCSVVAPRVPRSPIPPAPHNGPISPTSTFPPIPSVPARPSPPPSATARLTPIPRSSGFSILTAIPITTIPSPSATPRPWASPAMPQPCWG